MKKEAKLIKPFTIQFENDKQEQDFEKWVFSKEKSMSESAKRVREGLKTYREAKRNSTDDITNKLIKSSHSDRMDALFK
ncbi:hypothetical protein QRD86_00125 (plasmid) [Bacillus halotolerans]|uniref:hypothetical protein n=1 Tax=Bacillus halotolerans TaxID=260554 RepID=UPI0025709E17|nr:hypothetical protein [Bacillus halotolerans]WJE41194.1 hypothetical protein QRD86_00125 [Bacillus halotolerans]